MKQIDELKFWIYLLELEVEALRSVLSEFPGDKMEYVQMIKADSIDQLKKSMRCP